MNKIIDELEAAAKNGPREGFTVTNGVITLSPLANPQNILKLCAMVREVKEIIEKSSKYLDRIKFDLEASVYTLIDDQFETTFFVRDTLLQALKKLRSEE